MCLLQTAARSTQNLFQCAILAGDPDFMDKIVLITGASRGIGAATAQLAARQGWAVAVNYQGNQAAADAVVQQIRAAGGTALAVQAEEPTLRPYKEFPGSLLHLPDSGPLCVRLMVKSLHRQLNQNGSESWRAGCQFTDLPRGADALIQRYIFRLERQRSARERGAA